MTTKLDAAAAVSNPWEQATLLINGKKVERGAKPVLLRGQENEVTVENPPELVMTIRLGLHANGGLKIDASPDFKEWVAPNNGKFTWIITPEADKSGLITLVFYSREVDPVWEHRSLVISSNLADEAEALIGGELVPPEGVIFTAGEPQVVTLRLKNDSPLEGYPVKLKGAVVEGDLTLESQPDFDGFETKHSWTVTVKSGTGSFRLSFAGESMAQDLILPDCRLIAVLRWTWTFGTPMPVPPESIDRAINLPINLFVTLLDSRGEPMAGIPVTFHIPEHGSNTNITDLKGSTYPLWTQIYYTPGMREFRAEVELPGSKLSASLLVNVK